MKQVRIHILTWMTGLMLIIGLVLPASSWSMVCSQEVSVNSCGCSHADGATHEDESHQDAGHEAACCCYYEASQPVNQTPVQQVPAPEFRLMPVVTELLFAITNFSDSFSDESANHYLPDLPSYSSRHILALQSVLLI